VKPNGGTLRWFIAVVVAATSLTVVADRASAASGQITTVAGGLGSGGPLDIAQAPRHVAVHGSLVYTSEPDSYVVRVFDLAGGNQRVVVGNGTEGSSGDGGPGTAAQIYPDGLAVDAAGNLFVSDAKYHKVRRVDTAGIVTTVAGRTIPGSGDGGFSGDGGAATNALIAGPAGLAFDRLGNLLVADSGNMRIRKIDASGVITTIAGNGVRGEAGDGGPALAAQLDVPSSLGVGPLGDIFLGGFGRIRKIGLDGVITTIAGTGETLHGGDGGPALLATVFGAGSIKFDSQGNMLFTDYDRVRKIDTHGVITKVAGNGSIVFSGEGGPATAAGMQPVGLAIDGADRLYLADQSNHRLRRIGADGIITTVAGNGARGFSGDGGPAVTAQIGGPWASPASMTSDPAGNIYIAVYASVMRIDASGQLTNYAGDARERVGFSGDGGPATSALFGSTDALTADAHGNLFIADSANNRVRRVDASGTITTVAGNGVAGLSGDGGPATQASLTAPSGVAVDGAGNLFISDSWNHRIRRVGLDGTILPVAGTTPGFSGDGGPAGQAQFTSPTALAFDPTGALIVLEAPVGRIRRIARDGIVTSVSTGGMNPQGFTIDAAGRMYVSDVVSKLPPWDNPIQSRVRRLDPNGSTVIAGIGPEGFSGDGGPATSAQLHRPRGLAFDLAGNLYIADIGNGKIRMVEGVGPSADSTVLSWGLNNLNQLGRGAAGVASSLSLAVPVPGATTAVQAGAAHSLALADDGTVSAWGYGAFGQLGTGSLGDSARPVPVKGLTNATAIAAGGFHNLAARQDGSVVTWGWNGLGQLGDGTTTDRAAPVAVAGLTGVVAVSAGMTHSLALDRDGTVWAWGLNHVGQLGIGSAADSRVPIRIPQLTGVVAIAAGAYHSVALRNDGSVWTWGWDVYGQLGIGETTDRSTPVRVTALSGVTAIAAGGFHTLALKADGTVWGFGLNHVSQLGAGPITRPLPARVAGLDGVRDVAAGTYHSLAVTTDGAELAWGWNAFGQLGDGTTTDRPVPVPIAVRRTAAGLAGGLAHSVAATPVTSE
jgi:alpha-tubulin suppressor-like RCC1 family protein/sugar lactone lactonase YvrE